MYRVKIIALMCAVLLLALAPVTHAQVSPGKAVPPQSSALGMSYPDWAATWWQWALTLPAEAHPLFEGPCETGQSGNVWFLGGTFGGGTLERSCQIPSGTALFFPVVNTAYLAFEEDEETEEEIRELAQATFTELGAEVNGVPITDLDRYLVESPLFVVPEPLLLDDFGFNERNVRGVTTGVYLLIPPLPVGDHTLTFRGSVDGGELLDVTYHLTVVPRGRY